MKSNERKILYIIKYLPVFFTLLISGILTFHLYFQNIERFKKEANDLENNYININKENIKYQVERIKQNILDEKNNQRLKLKSKLKEQVTNAHKVALSIYKNNQDKSKEEITKLIKDALRDVRFNEGRGYFFIFSLYGRSILHPIQSDLENKQLWNYQDKKGTYLIQNMNKILKEKKSTYYSWYWTKPNNNKEELEKLGYFKLFEPYDWFIGTGEYIKDFENEIRMKLSNKLNTYEYKKNSYIFALDYDGNYISYHNKDMIGKNLRDFNILKDTDKIFKVMVHKAKNKPGFFAYKHYDKPLSNDKIDKISYIDGVKDWKWVIGTGFYMDDFYEEMKLKKEKIIKVNNSDLKELLLLSFIFTLILLAILIYISKILEREFIKYTKEIERQINNNIKKDRILAHQSKMAAMGEMIGNIAHQWRQPLSTISTITTGLKIQRENGIQDKELENEAMDRINKHVQYLSQTIDDFRNFFNTTKTKNKFRFVELFKKAFTLVEVKCEEKDILVVKKIKDFELHTLENELLQVLINILNNAIDSVEKLDTKRIILIDSEVLGKNFVIRIKDNGRGIDLKNMSKIFEPYFTTKNKTQGTGIGLFMSEQIVTNHLGGSINVKNAKFKCDSNSYKGAIFEIILPIEEKE